MSEHHRRLERMFDSAPIQKLLPGAKMTVSEGKSTYTLPITASFFHAADAMHGAVYFKLLDDSAYFAAASIETKYFILTKSYQVNLRRPVTQDQLTAEGTVTEVNANEIVASSKVINQNGKVVAEGRGIFVRGPKRLKDLPGYIE